jgi:hypothetical protein
MRERNPAVRRNRHRDVQIVPSDTDGLDVPFGMRTEKSPAAPGSLGLATAGGLRVQSGCESVTTADAVAVRGIDSRRW